MWVIVEAINGMINCDLCIRQTPTLQLLNIEEVLGQRPYGLVFFLFFFFFYCVDGRGGGGWFPVVFEGVEGDGLIL